MKMLPHMYLMEQAPQSYAPSHFHGVCPRTGVCAVHGRCLRYVQLNVLMVPTVRVMSHELHCGYILVGNRTLVQFYRSWEQRCLVTWSRHRIIVFWSSWMCTEIERLWWRACPRTIDRWMLLRLACTVLQIENTARIQQKITFSCVASYITIETTKDLENAVACMDINQL